MQLRPYQSQAAHDTIAAWNAGHRNILVTLATGAGKTIIMIHLIRENGRAAAVIAHRSELVSQISLALAQFGVVHRIIAPDTLTRFIMQNNHKETGKTWIDPNSPIAAVSVDTLTARYNKEIKARDEAIKACRSIPHSALLQWAQQVSLWEMDEAHHVLLVNKWGKAAAMFPNAAGLGVTATPLRADGKGLGRHHDGLFDYMVEGPSMRELINMNYLTEYRIFCPPSDMDLTGLKRGKDGDYTAPGLKKASEKSHIVGDVVEHYKKYASGKRGITFATDVETASHIAAQFNAGGVPALMVSAKTPDLIRLEAVNRLKSGELMQLVNVDLFGEGFDLPAIEVVSMARPTASFGLYSQQFGRALRLLDGKKFGLIIDHVQNVVRHGLPDAHRVWTLDRREKRGKGQKDDVPPVTACPACFQPYSGFLTKCPWCGHKPEPAARDSIEFVAGDLFELDAETLAAMRGDVAKVNMDAAKVESWMRSLGHSEIAARGAANRHRDRLAGQGTLRECMARWGGVRHADGASDAEIQKEFYWKYGVDVMAAMTLGVKDAAELEKRIGS